MVDGVMLMFFMIYLLREDERGNEDDHSVFRMLAAYICQLASAAAVA